MTRTRTVLLLSLAILVGALLVPTGYASASSLLKVFVTNTAANPVPVTGSSVGEPVRVDGSVNVDEPVTVDGTVTVDEPVSVDGSVSVNGPVQVADAREPFETRVDVDLGNGDFGGNGTFSVPAGKRLVVEFVAAQVALPDGQLPLMSANAQNAALGYPIPLTRQGVGNGNAFFTGSMDALDFANAGTYLISLSRQNPAGGAVPGTAGGFVYISGYLLPA